MNRVDSKHLPLLLKPILQENYVRTVNERERIFELCAKSVRPTQHKAAGETAGRFA